MNLSRWSRIAEWAVVAAVLGLQAPMLLPDSGEVPGFVVYSGRQALMLSQPAIFLAWAILGPGRGWWRVPTAMLLFSGVALWWGAVPYGRSWSANDSMFLAFCAMLVALVGSLRLGGMRVRGWDPARQPRAQFSIRMLLVATTVIAAVIGVLEYLRPALAMTEMQEVLTFGFPGGIISLPNETFTTTLRALVLGAASAALAAGALFVVLRPGAVWLRAIVLAVVVPAFAGYLIHLIDVSDTTLTQRVGELAWAFAALAGMTAVTALPLRLFGFQLYRPAVNPRSVTTHALPKKQAPTLSESVA